MPVQNFDDLEPVRDVAARLGRSVRTLMRWASQPDGLPVVYLGQRPYLHVPTTQDGEVTRMTVYCEPGKLDVGRGVRLARHAYRSRMKSEPPEIVAASFEHSDGREEPVDA
jgi:hypothetical protein